MKIANESTEKTDSSIEIATKVGYTVQTIGHLGELWNFMYKIQKECSNNF